MTNSVVAKRYARALFDLENKKGLPALDKSARDLADLQVSLDSSAELDAFLRNPVFSAAEKKKVLAALAKKLDLGATVLNFCALLADKERLDCFRRIVEAFRILLDAKKGIARGECVTAIPLNEARRGQILAALREKSGRPLELQFQVDPAILGGMLLRLGDTTRDASLLTQLTLLKDNIKRGE